MRSFWRWMIIVLGAAVALALTGAGVLAYLVSRLDVRPEIERLVEGATGRDLTISGDVGVSFWPVLGLRAEDVALSNVEGGRAPAFLDAQELDIGVQIMPLFRRDVVVQRLVLQRPRIALEVDAQGAPNWLLRSSAPPSAPPQPSPNATPAGRTTLQEIRIVDGEASFFDARRGSGWVVGDIDTRTAFDGFDQPMNIDGSIRYNDRPVEIELALARPGAMSRGELTPLRLAVRSELIVATFEGQTIAASGELAGMLSAEGPSLRQLGAWTGVSVQDGAGLGQFAVSGRVAIGEGVYDFSNAGFALDLLRGRGDFTLSEVRGKPYLSGRLELFDFDLNPYLTGQAPPQVDAAAQAAAASAPADAPAQAEIAAVAPPPRALDVETAPTSTPIDFSGLQSLNADLELVTHAVLIQHMRVDAARLNLVLNDGFLAATLHNMTLYGGSGQGRFEIDARAPATRMFYDLVFSNVSARDFLGAAANFDNIEGRAEMTVNLRTLGATQTEMIAGMDGRIHLEVVSGVLHGVDLGGVASTIRSAVRGELIAPEARTAFHGFSATFAIADGVLASNNLSFNTPNLRIPGIGVIDLNARRLDVRLAARSPRGGLVAPFSVRGPWTQLTYAHDLSDRAQREIQARVREVDTASRAAAPAN